MIHNITRGIIRTPQAALALEAAVSDQDSVSGSIIFGYPTFTDQDSRVSVDALIVSDNGAVTVFDLVQDDHPGNYRKRQDQAFNLVHSKLMADSRLTRGRVLLPHIQTVTLWTQAGQDNLSDTECPLVTPSGILAFVQSHQAQEREPVDPFIVMEAIMFMGRYEW